MPFVLKKVVNNKIVGFIASKYFIYVIQFINSLIIAKYLGPYFFGLWGFILLATQYLTQLNFGIPYSLNVLLALNEGEERQKQEKYLGNAILIIIFHSVLILVLMAASHFFSLELFEKYRFYSYVALVTLNAISQNINSLFVNVFRIKGKLKPIIYYQALSPCAMLIVSIFFRESALLYALLAAQLTSNVISLFIFIANTPIGISMKSEQHYQKQLFTKGISLLVYNASFYFIMIITRSFVGYFFSVENLGYFSFSLNLAQASFLALDSVGFLIFPTLITKFKTLEGEELSEKVDLIRSNYSLVAYFLVFVSILAFPVLLIFIPDFSHSYKPFALLSASMAILSNSFGISTLFISFGKEKLLGKVAFGVLIVNTIIVWIISSTVSNFYYVCFSPCITYFIYTILLGYLFNRYFNINVGFKTIVRHLELGLLLPTLVLAYGILTDRISIVVLATALIVILNHRKIWKFYNLLKQLVKKPLL